MTEIYLIRHAEAEGNIFRRLHGQYNSRLTSNGLRQVEALADRFASVQIDRVYASDLCRTCQTAQAICGPKQLPLIKEPRFRETFVGSWENRTFGELERSEPEELFRFARDPEHWIAPGAETYEDYSRRFQEALTEVAEANPGKTIAVFSHGCVMSGGMHRILGIPHDASRCDNTGVSLLRYENGVFTPEYLFDNSHLSESLSTHARQRWWRQQGGSFNLWFRDPLPADRRFYAPEFFPQKGHRIRIAMLKEEAVGYVAYSGETISTLYLLPEYRHRRMGDQLFGEALIALRVEGASVLNIGIPTVNVEALSFFAHHGAALAQMDDVYTVYRMDISVPAL